MIRLKDIIDAVSWEQVEDTLTVRSVQPRNRPHFRNVLKQLRFLQPRESKLRLLVEYTENDTGDYIHACGIGKPGSCQETNDRFGLYFTRWEECLGMEIVDTCLKQFDPAEIVAAAIAVMAFDGVTQGLVRAKAESLKRSRRRRVFLSYSHDDKELVGQPLAASLYDLGLSVWYDDYELLPGDSLRKSIAAGISQSAAGVVVLSKSYFRKRWTERELAGIVTMETSKRFMIIPVWHQVSLREVTAYDPSLADRLALSTGHLSVDEIATRIYEALLTRFTK